MPVNWTSYKQDMIDGLRGLSQDKSLTPAQAPLEISNLIVDGYVNAMSGGGDMFLGAKVILNPAGVMGMKASIIGALSAAFAAGPAGNAVMLASAINIGVISMWTGAMLNCLPCSPLPGHIGHSPVSMVLVPGVMLFVPPVFIPSANIPPNQEVFVTNLVNAMMAHSNTVGGMHPAMMLPIPAPPYPLPWIKYL